MADVEECILKFAKTFKSFSNEEKTLAIETILLLCEPEQLHFLSEHLPNFVKRDFIQFLPHELALNVFRYLDYISICRCRLVSKRWNEIISGYNAVWLRACTTLGVASCRLMNNVNTDWKYQLKIALARMKKLRCNELCFKRRLLPVHSKITALYYSNGLLACGSVDRYVRLWDMTSNECKYEIKSHSTTQLKFHQSHVYTASWDHTLAKWEWSTGACVTRYSGHVGSVFCLDYSSQLDLLVSGSSDCSVKFWRASTGSCLATKTGHEEWLIELIFSNVSPERKVTLNKEHVAISMSKHQLRIWSTEADDEFCCIASLPVPARVSFHAKLFCNGHHVMCSSSIGVVFWDMTSPQAKWILSAQNNFLLASGELFSLCSQPNYLHIVNNYAEKSLCKISIDFRMPSASSDIRYIDCIGETSWLHDCCEEYERGVLCIMARNDEISILEWNTKSYQ